VIALPKRDWAVFLAISIAYCVAFLIEPDWNLQEAHFFCAKQPVQVFESMTACSANLSPGCSCVRPQNPWVIVYWLGLLSGTGIAAALLLRAKQLLSLVIVAGAMAVGGYFGFLLLSRRELFEPEAWFIAPYAIAVHIAITFLAFWLARLTRHLVVKRRPAT